MPTWTAPNKPNSSTIEVGQEKHKTTVESWPTQKGVVGDLNGTRNVRYLERASGVLAGKWTVVGFYDLTTAAWDGSEWVHLVSPDRGKALVDGMEIGRIDAMACANERAWVVTTTGLVFTWIDAEWRAEGGGGALFEKQRRFTRLARDGERLVLWGGKNGNRWSNDVLFFEEDTWRKAKKASPRATALKSENYWVAHDAEIGGLVRVGPEGVMVLRGERWEDAGIAAPPFVSGDEDDGRGQMVIASGFENKKTLWLDPLSGEVYQPGNSEPTAQVPIAPGLVTNAALKAQGAYFWNDFELVNERDWFWGVDVAAKNVYGMRLESEQSVCTLNLSSLF